MKPTLFLMSAFLAVSITPAFARAQNSCYLDYHQHYAKVSDTAKGTTLIVPGQPQMRIVDEYLTENDYANDPSKEAHRVRMVTAIKNFRNSLSKTKTLSYMSSIQCELDSGLTLKLTPKFSHLSRRNKKRITQMMLSQWAASVRGLNLDTGELAVIDD